MPYPYSQKNDLESPEYYMYSSYGGKEFLEEYFADRKRFLKLITKKIYQDRGIEPQEIHEDFQKSFQAIFEIVNQLQCEHHLFGQCDLEGLYSSWINRGTINTENALTILLKNLLKDSTSSNKKIYPLLNFFLGRYEVKKYIQDAYFSTKSLVKKDNLFLYAMASLCMILYFRISQNLKFLNASLKLNDLLCALNRRLNLKTLEIVRFSIHIETREIHNIINKEGITL